MSETQVDIRKVKGEILKDPTVTAALPISVENPALAYDAANDRFKINIAAIGGTAQTARDWSSDLAKLQSLPTDPAKESGKLTTIDSTLTDIDTVLDEIKALIAGGLPAALGGAGGLKVEEQNWPSTYEVTATDLDIRALTETERTPLGSQTQPLQQKAVSYDLIVTLDSETVTVQATNLDIRDLTETERTPLGSSGVALQQVAGDNALRVREQAFPDDYPDAATLALLTTKLAGGLPSALATDKLKVRATEIETLLAGGLPAALSAGGNLKVSLEEGSGGTVDIGNWPADYPDSAVATLLAGGLPAALDAGALKIKEQSPISGFATDAKLDDIITLLAGGLPAALGGAGGLKVEEQSPITSLDVDNFPADYPDSAVATLLGGGLPAALDGLSLKVKEQSPAYVAATTAEPHYETMTSADTEYDESFTGTYRKFSIWTSDLTAFRFAFETGKVAGPTEPCIQVSAKIVWSEDHLTLTNPHFYFACGTAGKVINILLWK